MAGEAPTALTHAAAVGADGEHCPLMPTYAPPTVELVRGEGCYVWDRDGKRYLDLLCGLAVTSLGHAHPEVTDTLSHQAGRLIHVSNLFANEHQGPLAATIDRLLGGGGQVFLANSGAEANECALKLARKFGGRGRHVVVSAYGSFHGRTLATLHATGQPSKHEAFQPLPEGFRHVAWGDVDALAAALHPDVAAVLLEPIQGEGGVLPAPPGYLAAVRELCDERGVLLMLDEVQTGLGRTGEWFAHNHDGVRPDLVTLAKALGNGVPIGACWARQEVAAAFEPGDHGSTYGGQPLAAAAARTVLEVMERDDLPSRAAEMGTLLANGLASLDHVLDVRGRGLLLAAELDTAALGRDAKAIQAELLAAGAITNAVTPTALRLAPPLIIDEIQVQEAVALVRAVLAGEAP